jgi:hypothetical protein
MLIRRLTEKTNNPKIILLTGQLYILNIVVNVRHTLIGQVCRSCVTESLKEILRVATLVARKTLW